jgi:hypothetical protein
MGLSVKVAATLLIACALALAGCGTSAAPTSAPRAPATQRRVAAGAGVSVGVLRGWHLTPPPITAMTFPAERLLLTSYPARRGGNCAPDRAARDLATDGALVYLFEYRPRPRSSLTRVRLTDFPARPAHFALRPRDRGTFECWRVPSYLIRFRVGDRRFQVHVALGVRATSARRAQVLRTLDSLHITRTPPPSRDRPAVTAARLEAALRTNPNGEATSAECTKATDAQRKRARPVFGRTRLPLFVCDIALGRQGAERFDVQVLGSGCFVAERRRPGQADVGCIRR